MAAEKLTRARLAQILFMMLLLVSAFIWRSVTHSNHEVLCKIKKNCLVESGKYTISAIWENTRQQYHISIKPDNKNWSIEQTDNQTNLLEKEDYWTLDTEKYPVRLKVTQTETTNSPVYYLNFR
ncbi:hypothetical protein [Vibrio sp. MA40-2]|uniref:hypothetical protein n=1 Tax=Vibrio sp. MA40-2 TaxID=3391828 RepID=UPI0039A4BBFF